MDIKIAAQKFYDYSTYMRGYSKDTLKRYKFVINYYCRIENITELEQVNSENLRNLFYYGRTARKWSPNTFLCFQKTLVVFFRWCIENNYMTKNPAQDIEVPRLEKRLPSKLTKQEAMKLLEVIYNYPYKYKFLRYRNHAIFATFIYTGLRKQELMKLRYTDVDLENFSLFVNQGKGSKDRVMPISYTLAESLKRYLIERNRLKKTCPEFFVSLNRNMGITETGMKRLVELARGATNIKFSFHKLRHTFATLMLEGGCDIFSLSKMLGHNDLKTTSIYLAASAEHLRAQMTKHPLNNI